MRNTKKPILKVVAINPVLPPTVTRKQNTTLNFDRHVSYPTPCCNFCFRTFGERACQLQSILLHYSCKNNSPLANMNMIAKFSQKMVVEDSLPN